MASALWDKSKNRNDLERAAITYDSAAATYDSISVYYDGYNPSTYTPEGEAGTVWLEVAE